MAGVAKTVTLRESHLDLEMEFLARFTTVVLVAARWMLALVARGAPEVGAAVVVEGRAAQPAAAAAVAVMALS